MSLFDEDEMECEYCGHIGLVLNGDFDVECPVCGAEYSLIDEEQSVILDSYRKEVILSLIALQSY